MTDKELNQIFEDTLALPIPDELKQVIEEILRKDEKAREELTRLGLLGFMKKHGGEIRMTKKRKKAWNHKLGRTKRKSCLPWLD